MVEHVARGVYTMPYLSAAGEMLLVAVNSLGRRIAIRAVPEADNPYDALADLWAELNATDPPKQASRLDQSA